MTTLPAPAGARICMHCRYWAPAYVGPKTYGFCTWRESENKSRQPRMNVGSRYQLSAGGRVLETKFDASCIQFEPKK